MFIVYQIIKQRSRTFFADDFKVPLRGFKMTRAVNSNTSQKIKFGGVPMSPRNLQDHADRARPFVSD